MHKFKVTVLGSAASVLIIVGAVYIKSLRSDLNQARQDSLASEQQVQKLRASLGQTEASLASATHVHEQLEAQLAQSKSKLEGISTDLAKQIEALKKQVSDLQADVTYRNKVSDWWRDLFDYTKPFNELDTKSTPS